MLPAFHTRINRIKSAWRGVILFFERTPHAWARVAMAAASVAVGVYVGLGALAWAVLIVAAGLLLVSEAFNTAIEIVVDMASPDIHPLARDAKDVAAGAAMLSTFTALALWVAVFAPHLA